jgi:hypothetical protein
MVITLDVIKKENKVLFYKEKAKQQIDEVIKLYIERIANLDNQIAELKEEMKAKCLQINSECAEKIKQIRESK